MPEPLLLADEAALLPDKLPPETGADDVWPELAEADVSALSLLFEEDLLPDETVLPDKESDKEPVAPFLSHALKAAVEKKRIASKTTEIFLTIFSSVRRSRRCRTVL